MLRQEWVCLIGAGVLHLAVPVAAAIAPKWVPVTYAKATAASSEIDVDVDSALLPPMPRDYVPDRSIPLGAARSIARTRSRFDPYRRPGMPMSPTAMPNAELPLSPDGTVLLPDPDGPAVPDEYLRPPSAGAYGPYLPGYGSGYSAWAYPGALPDSGPGSNPAPTTAPRREFNPDAATDAVQDGLRKRDRKLGLDFPGRGPIRSAFVSATYASDAPYECSASFVVTVSSKGKITNVSYGGHSGGTASTWKAVRKAVAAQLKSAKLPMKSAFSKGAIVSVFVRSKKRTPGGGTSRDGATISFDVTDIGARATRIVSASVSPSPIR